jgi:hypothetical protein
MDFFRFPHTGHLAWLGPEPPRDDKLLSEAEVDALLVGDVIVEEKIDGANLGLSLDDAFNLRAQNRGQYLTTPYGGQFARLGPWLAEHRLALEQVLDPDLMLFGEWCAAVHSIAYDQLPDWFLLFDVYDRPRGAFWSTTRRNRLAAECGLATVPEVHRGRVGMGDLFDLLASRHSCHGPSPIEGVVVRRDAGDWCVARGKLVRSDFTQAIGEHWRARTLHWNRLRT